MFAKKNQQNRSPIREKPLRNPGQSLDREIERLVSEDIVPYISIIAVAIIFAAFEWWRALTQAPPQPVQVTIVTLVVICFSVYKIARNWHRLNLMELGLEGEKVVGQGLEDLRRQGCRVLHDIPGKGFNLDHVVISPQGIFVIETKTFTKPAGHQAKVEFDGQKILVNGFEPSRNLVAQAEAERLWLQELVLQMSAKSFRTRAAIVFPGWYVINAKRTAASDIWVLNPRALPGFIAAEPEILKPEDIALVTHCLSVYVRSRP